MKEQTATPDQKNDPPKSASITLRANGAVMTLLATCKEDGNAVTTVTTRDAEKKTTRGMTETHKSMADAKAHLSALAEKAEKLGWQRGQFAMRARPDAFTKLPAAPKATTT